MSDDKVMEYRFGQLEKRVEDFERNVSVRFEKVKAEHKTDIRDVKDRVAVLGEVRVVLAGFQERLKIIWILLSAIVLGMIGVAIEVFGGQIP